MAVSPTPTGVFISCATPDTNTFKLAIFSASTNLSCVFFRLFIVSSNSLLESSSSRFLFSMVLSISLNSILKIPISSFLFVLGALFE